MSQLKMTKTELRTQQVKLVQLQKYLPTLQLKKAMLQVEVSHAQQEIENLFVDFDCTDQRIEHYAALFTDRNAIDLFSAVKIKEVKKRYENIAGIETPLFEDVEFEPSTYALFDTPPWMESAVDGVKELLNIREKIKVVQEKKEALEKELRDVSIRVNLFEKIMIPRAQENIKKIKIFLSDLQLAAVSQAKVSKEKILIRKRERGNK